MSYMSTFMAAAGDSRATVGEVPLEPASAPMVAISQYASDE
jgi:hypothetical protein